jgi:hypothetical protein
MNRKKLGQAFIAPLLVAGLLALVSCSETASVTSGPSSALGPGQASAPAPGQGTAGASGTRVQLLVSNPQLPSSGATQVDLTAVVLDVNGQAVSGASVIFSTGTDPSAFVNGISGGGITDSNGQVTAKLNLGANKSNRTITVTVTTADGATISNTVGVTGTSITISGNSSLALNASTTLTFALKDSAGTPIPNVTMAIASQTGNAVAPASTLTDVSGQITATVTAIVASNDVITASAAGASKTQALTVSSAAFAFTTPASNIDIPLGAPTPVSVHWTNNLGAPQSGQVVSFSTSRGAITATSTVNGAGDTPGVSIVSTTSAGPAIITAQGPGGTPAATLSVNFVATSASSVAVQAVPTVVQFTTNSPSQTNNISTISVTVRDTNNNLVKNASITFTLTDVTGGFLAANTATTDVTGSASVNYTAGSISSAKNGVKITANVDKVNGVAIPVLTSSATLTVAGQSLFVRLGTDNLVQPVPAPQPDLQKTWSAIVTDAAGNAVVGTQVRFSLVPTRFSKGFYQFDAIAGRWVQQPAPPITCLSEDNGAGTAANANNGILDPGEDTNGNGRLDPGNVASVNATGTTDANGIALATLTYPKSYATWTEVQLQASAGVVGNDPPTTATFFLVGLASDYTNKDVPPPGEISPFGVVQNCADPN